MRRLLLIVALAVVGCGPGQQWSLVLDGAQLSPATTCADGLAPDTYALARVAGVVRSTGQSSHTLAPEWHSPVAEGTVAEYARGIDLGVFTRCAGETGRLVGSTRLRPSKSFIEGGRIQVPEFGAVARLDLHFELISARSDSYPPPAPDEGSVSAAEDIWCSADWSDGNWDESADDPVPGDDDSSDGYDSSSDSSPSDSGGDYGSSSDSGGEGGSAGHQGHAPRRAPRARIELRAPAAIK